MINKDENIVVANRYDGFSGYALPDRNIQRSFAPGEKKNIPFDELQSLVYQPGGINLLRDYLVIENEEVVKELLGSVEPEYFYTVEDVKNILMTGSYEQFLDTLDFAPQAIIEMIEDMAVSLEIPDMRKREAIMAKSGFDVTTAINNMRIQKAAEDAAAKPEEAKAPVRRTSVVATTEEKATSGRRTAAPKYTIKK